tara:strand:+ start:998 stop:1132 length:135 start_codon:yes stop_codon:yes gene_type:complete
MELDLAAAIVFVASLVGIIWITVKGGKFPLLYIFLIVSFLVAVF